MRSLSGNQAAAPDPDYSPTVEVFDQMRYDEIYRGVLQMNPEVLTAGRQAWQNAAAGVGDAVAQAHAEIRGAIADGWRGSAAQQAAAAMQAFEQLGQHVADVMSAVAQRLGQANDAAETLRGAVSRPVDVGADLEAALLDPKRATLNVAAQKQAEGVRQDVVRVMDTVYAGAFVPTGNGVPGFPQGGMYPAPEAPAPGPGVESGPDATDSLGGPDAVATGGPNATAPQAADGEQPTESEPGSGAPAEPGDHAVTPAAAAPLAPAAATAPAAAAATEPAVAPASDRPATAPASVANTVAPQQVSAPSAAAALAPGQVPVAPRRAAGAATRAQNSDDQRKREEQEQRHEPTSDAVGGMGAGVVGGLAGSALAAGDAVRSGTGVPVPPKRSQYDEDDDEEYYDFDEPTYLEPAEPGTELVGQLDPTTPPVVGEWAEDY